MRNRLIMSVVAGTALLVGAACADKAESAPASPEALAKAEMVAGGVTNLTGTVAALSAPETITTVGTTTKDKFIDVGKRTDGDLSGEFSVGDTFFTTVDIKNQAGVDLGTERTQCMLGTGRWALCTGTFDITGRGEIIATGAVNFGTELSDFDVPITGGTSEFANVGGVVHVHITAYGETDTLELLP
jgi:hypothetical protein